MSLSVQSPFIYLLIASLSGCVTSAAERSVARSVAADQADRKGTVDWSKVSPADEIREKRVGEIFGEGCFKEARDYAAAALVFQHGSTPDHFYQAYLWSKKAIELGDSSQRGLMVDAIDRYLINIGHKQIFGAQYFRTAPGGCPMSGTCRKEFSR